MLLLRDVSHDDFPPRFFDVPSLQISDFGLSRQLTNGEYRTAASERDIQIPIRWSAPEAIRADVCTAASDVCVTITLILWLQRALGAVCYHMRGL